MTDLELETLKQMRELCAEQMERAPTSGEYVDWRNKSWIIDGILEDEKERRELESVQPDETENVTENKTESEDIEMSTTNNTVFYNLSETAISKLKDTFRKLAKYRPTTITSRGEYAVLTKDNYIVFCACNGTSIYYSEQYVLPRQIGCGEWLFSWADFGTAEGFLKGLDRTDVLTMAYENDTIIFKSGEREVSIKKNGARTLYSKMYRITTEGKVTGNILLDNASQIADIRKAKGRSSDNDTMKITHTTERLYLDDKPLHGLLNKWPCPLTYCYEKRVSQVFSGNKKRISMRICELDGTYYYTFNPPESNELILVTTTHDDQKKLSEYKPGDSVAETAKEGTGTPAKPEPEKEEIEMTAIEIKPAKTDEDFTFSVSTNPTVIDYIGLDDTPGIDLSKPTDKKTTLAVKCKRPDLGEFIRGNKTYELYRNDELKRYRLAFNKHLTKDERDYLWTNKWTWRKEFKCYQWGYTKNGDKAARNAIEYFETR